jgi:hypothetical protein
MLAPEQISELMAIAPGLSKQSYDDINKLSASSPEVISRQPTINIGTIGHVSHGKSTLVEAISGVHVNFYYGKRIEKYYKFEK